MFTTIYQLLGSRITNEKTGEIEVDNLGNFFNRAAAEKEKMIYEDENLTFNNAYKTFWIEELYEPIN